MKAEKVAIVVLVGAIAGVVVYLEKDRFASSGATSSVEAQPQAVSFEGRTLQAPAAWRVTESTNGVLSLMSATHDNLPPTLTLEDERLKPEVPGGFVAGWKNAQRYPDFHPLSLEEFHDAAVDQAGAPCVRIDWGGTRRPLRIVCLASDGRWKLTLSGSASDVGALDMLAQQLPEFTRGL